MCVYSCLLFCFKGPLVAEIKYCASRGGFFCSMQDMNTVSRVKVLCLIDPPHLLGLISHLTDFLRVALSTSSFNSGNDCCITCMQTWTQMYTAHNLESKVVLFVHRLRRVGCFSDCTTIF